MARVQTNRAPRRASRFGECTWAHHSSAARASDLFSGRTHSAGERLLGLQAGDGVEVAQDRGELLGGPRLAAVAAALAEAGEAERAAGLVLVDREVAGGRVPVAGAALRRTGPRPQPEMTTVRPSSRTLPTWKTDGLRLLLTESSPRQSRSRRGPVHVAEMRTGRDIGRNRGLLNPWSDNSFNSEGSSCVARPELKRNRVTTGCRRQFFPGFPRGVVGFSTARMGRSDGWDPRVSWPG